MDSLVGRVAVVTGGAGGIGRAMGERFLAEGMKVVLADVQAGPLEATVADIRAHHPDLRDAGDGTGLRDASDVIGVVTDVTNFDSVVNLRDATVSAFGTAHVLCNNAGIGAGAEGKMWEHELNDWRWAIGVNVMGVVHGINAFVGLMVAQNEGHVVNTSSGNGGISPLSSTPQYAATKAAVVTLTECLYGQLADSGSAVGASVLFPGPHMLRTGLFESWRSRTDEFKKQRPRVTPYTTVEALETQMRAAGIEPQYTSPHDVAGDVVAGILANQFWIHPASDRSDQQARARAESITSRTNPSYLRPVPG